MTCEQADYTDVPALDAAFAGIDKLLLISSNSLDRQPEHANVLAAAKSAGVKHIFYTSLLHAESWNIPFAQDHLVTEQWLKALGADYTILRNGWYWENNTPRFPAAVQFGSLIGGAGDAEVSWASRQDFADAAVAVMTGAGHEGETYELAGDKAYTLTDLAREAERQIGKPVAYTNLSEADFAATLEKAGLPKPMALHGRRGRGAGRFHGSAEGWFGQPLQADRPADRLHSGRGFRSPCSNHARRSVVTRQTTNGVTRACEARLHRRQQVRVKSYASAMMELPRPVLIGE